MQQSLVFSCRGSCDTESHYKQSNLTINSLLASGDFYHLLITFTNSSDPDLAPKNIGPDLDINSKSDSVPDIFLKISKKRISMKIIQHVKS